MNLITTAQAAARREVTVSTVSRWVSRGVLVPAVRLANGQMLFDTDSVDAIQVDRRKAR